MCPHLESRFQVVRESLLSRTYKLLEKIQDGCLEDRVCWVPVQEEQVQGLRWRPCPVMVPSKSPNRTEELFTVNQANGIQKTC